MERREDEPGRDGGAETEERIMLNVSHASHSRLEHISSCARISLVEITYFKCQTIFHYLRVSSGGGTAPVSTKLHSPL